MAMDLNVRLYTNPSASSSSHPLLQRYRIRSICGSSSPSSSSSSSSSSSPSTTASIAALESIIRPFNRRIAIARAPLLLLFLPPTPGSCILDGIRDKKPAFAAEVLLGGSSKESDAIFSQKKDSRSLFIDRVEEAIKWLENGKEAQAHGDFQQALLWYTQVVEKHGDLALSEYARVGRAISLYEVGDREDAFIEMEDVSISLKGYPEIHAALAAALYADKHSPVTAEQQFTIATLLDPNYIDLSYVKDTKHWPPNLIKSFERFINFQ